MHIVGRKEEQRRLDSILTSGKPEFVVVYGRRRIGKTYLVGEYFNQQFAFRATGLAEGTLREQLTAFATSLHEAGATREGIPRTWLEAFEWLKELLSEQAVPLDARTKRKVIFIDEMPWFDTPRSGFKTALEHFWNAWACTQEDIVLIACGSSTSWIAQNLLANTKGLYNRVTRTIDLQPLTIGECKEYLEWRGVAYSSRQIAECYMVFGGVPYYLDLQDRRLSLAQNINELLFKRGGQLVLEFDRLYRTLFHQPEPYVEVVRLLSTRRQGMLRSEIADATGMDGRQLTKLLSDLDLCGFTRSYRNFTKRSKGKVHQLMDPFSLFYLTFVAQSKLDDWVEFVGSHAYTTWCGLSFERLCLAHADLIKRDLGISGMLTSICAWRSEKSDPGAQIDLLIDRKDGVISLCEMKYSDGEYFMTAGDERSVRNKIAAFKSETGTRKAVHTALITLDGARHNAHFNSIVQGEVVVDSWIN